MVVTHVHLDHGSGTAALLELCPNATALAHPRAARHLVRPGRLVGSARRVYGDLMFDKLFGEVAPVAEHRMRAVEDKESLVWGSRTLSFLHTAGHATHHICMHDSRSNSAFTGDTFGVAFPPLQRGSRPRITCTCPPTDFDPNEARRTVERVVATGAEWACLSHFGTVGPVTTAAEQLLRSIDAMEAVLQGARASGLADKALQAFCETRVREAVEQGAESCGMTLTDADRERLQPDIHMNALGIAYAAQRQR